MSRLGRRLTPPTALLIALLAALLLAAPLALAQSGYSLGWWSMDGGGGTSAGGQFSLTGTIGQADASTLAGGTFALDGGFWHGGEATVVTEYRTFFPFVQHLSDDSTHFSLGTS